MEKIGVILARLQPIHYGHLALIEKSLQENDKTYVFVGSADKFNIRNPLPIGLRMLLAKQAFMDKFDWNEATGEVTVFGDSRSGVRGMTKYLHIVPLDDLTTEDDNSHDWGFYLYTKSQVR